MNLSFSATPPMASTDHDSDDSYYNSYFSKTYVPLSSLPTPPLSSHSNGSIRNNSPDFGLDESLDPGLLGPAIHLSNLIPSAVSLIDPSVHLVHKLLCYAELPLPTIALSCCILDSLNSRFALSWRRSCPLSIPSSPDQQVHIDFIRPEVIVLSAIIIAIKFLDDQECTTRLYSEDWGAGRWTCEQINATQQCIMANLGYRILPLWTKELISDALGDMERAGTYARAVMAGNNNSSGRKTNQACVGSVKAVWTAEKQLTPIETPISKDAPGAKDVLPEAKHKLSIESQQSAQRLTLEITTVTEMFPAYSEPISE